MNNLDASLVRAAPPFKLMSLSVVREALNLAQSRLVSAGHTIFEEGASAKSFYLLLDGHVRVERYNEDGERVISLHVPPGQLFGIARALGRDTYPATAEAAVDCVVLFWPTTQWDRFVAEYEGFGAEANRVLGQRVSEMNSRIMELATLHVEQRVASALLRMMHQHGRDCEDGVEIAFPVTRKIISEMTGSTLHTVSRLLAAWEKQGILCSHRKHVHVLDEAQLEKLSHHHRH